jgi:hypothetical protein
MFPLHINLLWDVISGSLINDKGNFIWRLIILENVVHFLLISTAFRTPKSHTIHNSHPSIISGTDTASAQNLWA